MASNSRLKAVLAALAVTGLVGGAAGFTYARLNATLADPSNSFTTTAISPPTGLASTHPSGTSGTVALSWTKSSSSFVTGQQVQRAPAPCSSFSNIGSALSASVQTYSDSSAAYNTQYCYRVLATYGSNWSQAGNLDIAYSLPATSGTDPTGIALYGVKFVSNTQGWAVGARGTILTTGNGGTTWSTQGSGVTTKDLYAVWFASASTGWAVGQGGTVLSTTNGGTTWSAQTSGVSTDLYGVVATSTSNVWAVGQSGVIRVTSNGGTAWSSQTSNTTNNLYAVSASSTSTNIWTVGQGGVIRLNPSASTASAFSWTIQTSPTTKDLYGVSQAGSGNKGNAAFAVGQSGTFLSVKDGGNPSAWQPMSAPNGFTGDLYAVSAISGCSHAWAVGPGASIINYTDSAGNCNGNGFAGAWTAQTPPSGFTNDLAGVGFSDATHGWAVGQVGSIANTSTGGTGWSSQASGLSSYSLTGPYSTASTDLNALSVSDSASYTERGAWAVRGYTNSSCSSGNNLRLGFTVTGVTGATVSKAVATTIYKASVGNSSATARLLVSGDSGTSFTSFTLAPPTSTSSVTSTTDISSVINSLSTAQSMVLCLQVAANGGGAITTPVDLVQVQLN
ncbi:MAG TPA: YCF48-related protein [Candidatus Solibacter sp.]|nr:YCF48-related protein [Candidatus Solibacter sp.]